MTAQLIAKQMELEKRYNILSIDRSRAAIKAAISRGDVAAIKPIDRVINAAFATVESRLTARVTTTKARGVKGADIAHLKQLDMCVIANATLVILFKSLLEEQGSTLQSILRRLGNMVQSECLIYMANATAPAYTARVMEYLRSGNTTSANHILRTMRATCANIALTTEAWGTAEVVRVGSILLECAMETGLFEISHKKGCMTTVNMHPDIEKLVLQLIEDARCVTVAPPMIIPPCDHEDMYTGGYLTTNNARPTYRNKALNTAELAAVNKSIKESPQILGALNKLQNVKYVVNKKILEVVTYARKLGVGIGMPATIDPPKPVWRLAGVSADTYTAKEKDEFDVWKKQVKAWYTARIKRLSALSGIATALFIANDMKDEPALYFPTCVDWRYRIYFKSSLQPQGTDVQKALLLFGDKKPLGKTGMFWLKVHIATCFGYDKTLFDDRAKWVDNNIEQLKEMVLSPLDSELMRNADSPWCMLAAVYDMFDAIASPNVEEYCSGIPVAMDATNSVGQHFSAMLRDPVGGKLTNLFWDGSPAKADLYMHVKNRTDEKIRVDANNPDCPHLVEANYWLERPPSRSMVKKPTMTLYYSATATSCMDNIVVSATDEGYEPLEQFSLNMLSAYLTKVLRPSIRESLPAAAGAMVYFRKLSAAVPNPSFLKWTTPTGGLVYNKYGVTTTTRVSINSLGIKRTLVVVRDNNTINKRKTGAAISPNIIHSLDAAHLTMVVNAFSGSIVPIHDSLATHACDVEDMHLHIRTAFYNLHNDNNIIDDIEAAAIECGADTSGITKPQRGALDLQRVVTSPFFFC